MTSSTAILAVINTEIDKAETALTVVFDAHPGAAIYKTVTGLGTLLATRILASAATTWPAKVTLGLDGTTPAPPR